MVIFLEYNGQGQKVKLNSEVNFKYFSSPNKSSLNWTCGNDLSWAGERTEGEIIYIGIASIMEVFGKPDV